MESEVLRKIYNLSHSNFELNRKTFHIISQSDIEKLNSSSIYKKGRIKAGNEIYYIVSVNDRRDEGEESDDIRDKLTKRELQIAFLVAKGKVNKQIAYQLNLSENTVCSYVKRACYKTQAKNRAELAAKLYEQAQW